jgi:hypothetical protein
VARVEALPVINGRPQVKDESQFSILRTSNGATSMGVGGPVSHPGYAYHEVVQGVPIFHNMLGDDGRLAPKLVGYRAEFDNHVMFNLFDAKGQLRAVNSDPYAENGAELRIVGTGDNAHLEPFDTQGPMENPGGILGDSLLRSPGYLLGKTRDVLYDSDPEAEAKADRRLTAGGFEEAAQPRDVQAGIAEGLAERAGPAQVGTGEQPRDVQALIAQGRAGQAQPVSGPGAEQPSDYRDVQGLIAQGRGTQAPMSAQERYVAEQMAIPLEQRLQTAIADITEGTESFASTTMASFAYLPTERGAYEPTDSDLVRLIGAEASTTDDNFFDKSLEVDDIRALGKERGILESALRRLDTDQPGVVAGVDAARAAYEQEQDTSILNAANAYASRYGLQNYDEEGDPMEDPFVTGTRARSIGIARRFGYQTPEERAAATAAQQQAAGFVGFGPSTGAVPMNVSQLPETLPGLIGPRGAGPRQYEMKVPNVNVPIPPAETAAWSAHDISAPQTSRPPVVPRTTAMPSWYKPARIPAPPSAASLQRTLGMVPRATPAATPKLPEWSPNDIGSAYVPPKPTYGPPAPTSSNIFDGLFSFFRR